MCKCDRKASSQLSPEQGLRCSVCHLFHCHVRILPIDVLVARHIGWINLFYLARLRAVLSVSSYHRAGTSRSNCKSSEYKYGKVLNLYFWVMFVINIFGQQYANTTLYHMQLIILIHYYVLKCGWDRKILKRYINQLVNTQYRL